MYSYSLNIIPQIVVYGLDHLKWDGNWNFTILLAMKDSYITDTLFNYLLNHIKQKHDDLFKFFHYLKKTNAVFPDEYVKQYIHALQQHKMLLTHFPSFLEEFDTCLNEDLAETCQNLVDSHMHYFNNEFVYLMNNTRKEWSIDAIMTNDEWKIEQ